MDYEMKLVRLPQSPKSKEDRMTPTKKDSPYKNNFNKSPIKSLNLFSTKSSIKPLDIDTKLNHFPVLPNPAMRSPKKRKINSKPYLSFDFYMEENDFYKHPLDWSAKNLIGIAKNKYVHLFDTKKTEILVSSFENELSSLTFIGNGDKIMLGDVNGTIYIKDIQAEKSTILTSFNNCDVSCIDAKSNQYYIFAFHDGSIGVYDFRAPSKAEITIAKGHSDICITVSTNPKNYAMFASSGDDNIVKIWDIRNVERSTLKYDKHLSISRAIAWSPYNDSTIVTGGGRADKKLNSWSYLTGETFKSIDVDFQISNVFWSKEYKELLVTKHDFVSIYDDSSLALIDTLAAHNERVFYAAMSPTNEDMVTITNQDILRFWRCFPKNSVGNSSIR